jgi:hypothetical protein
MQNNQELLQALAGCAGQCGWLPLPAIRAPRSSIEWGKKKRRSRGPQGRAHRRHCRGGATGIGEGGRRRGYRGGRLIPSGDGAQGGAANVRLGIADFTASTVGSGERLRRRTEAAADLCCPAADLCCPAAAGHKAAVARVLGTRLGVVAAAYKGPCAPVGVRATPRRRRGRMRPRPGLWLESISGTMQV